MASKNQLKNRDLFDDRNLRIQDDWDSGRESDQDNEELEEEEEEGLMLSKRHRAS
jgi:hypothetical protein